MHIPANRPAILTWLLRAAVLLGILILLWLTSVLWQKLVSSADTSAYIATDTARIGNLEDSVGAYGRLRPVSVTSLISVVSGRVQQVLVKPGAQLNKGQVIVRLLNPELQRELEEAELSVLEQQAEYEQVRARLAQEQLVLQNELDLVKGQLLLAQAERDAKQKLAEQNIISALDLQKAVMEVKQIGLRRKLNEEKLEAFEPNQRAQLNAARLRLQRAEKQFENVEQYIQELTVRATMDGVLNELSETIQPGALIAEGEVMGQISDPGQLYGQLLVSAGEAPRLIIGQPVRLNIKGQRMMASISRISPNVEENQVQVDVELQGDLPDVARPNIDIQAEVVISDYAEGLLVKRPEQVNLPDKTYRLYIKRPQQQSYKLTEVKVGALSKKYMQILSGMQQGDDVLLSVPADINGKKVIEVGDLNG
jgi:HlyD family secretion protein